MSLQTLSYIMNLLTNKEQKFNRPEKGGSFRRAGKKEGVWGRNFCLPAFLSFGFARCSFTRRPRGGGRRGHKHRVLPNFSWRLASMLLFEIGSNFVIQAAPAFDVENIIYPPSIKSIYSKYLLFPSPSPRSLWKIILRICEVRHVVSLLYIFSQIHAYTMLKIWNENFYSPK